MCAVTCWNFSLGYRMAGWARAGIIRLRPCWRWLRIPRERMRYALDIPYIARENSAAEILALKNAWARAAG